jgi:hypothetical protein
MSAEDMKINSLARGVLASYRVDQNTIYVTSHGGTVCLRGKLLEGDADVKPISSGTVVAIQDDIMKQKGVKKVMWQLDNWKMVGTRWVKEA